MERNSQPRIPVHSTQIHTTIDMKNQVKTKKRYVDTCHVVFRAIRWSCSKGEHSRPRAVRVVSRERRDKSRIGRRWRGRVVVRLFHWRMRAWSASPRDRMWGERASCQMTRLMTLII